MGSLFKYVSDTAFRKASDADFQTVLRNVSFRKTPQEVLTIKDMMLHHDKKSREGDEYW